MKSGKIPTVLLALPLLVATLLAQGDEGRRVRRHFQADLLGVNEVPLTLSPASGHLDLLVSEDESSVHYVLTYQGIDTHVLFAHIHLGQRNVSGGVTVFFCDNAPHPPRPMCPEGGGTVEGDFKADDVLAPGAAGASQHLAAGDLATLLGAIRRGETYANLHSTSTAAGEIRGQIGRAREEDD